MRITRKDRNTLDITCEDGVRVEITRSDINALTTAIAEPVFPSGYYLIKPRHTARFEQIAQAHGLAHNVPQIEPGAVYYLGTTIVHGGGLLNGAHCVVGKPVNTSTGAMNRDTAGLTLTIPGWYLVWFPAS